MNPHFLILCAGDGVEISRSRWTVALWKTWKSKSLIGKSFEIFFAAKGIRIVVHRPKLIQDPEISTEPGNFFSFSVVKTLSEMPELLLDDEATLFDDFLGKKFPATEDYLIAVRNASLCTIAQKMRSPQEGIEVANVRVIKLGES